MKKKILLCLGLGIVSIFVLGVVLINSGLIRINLQNVKTREESIIVSINPKVMYNTDDKGYVKEVIRMNEDAVIYNPEEFVGLYINDAVEKTIEVATKNGYVKEDTEINISSLSEDSVYLEDVIYSIGNTKLNVKTDKLSKQDIEDIKSNLENDEYTIWQNITVTDKGVVVEGESMAIPSEEALKDRDNTYRPELSPHKNNQTTQKPTQETTQKPTQETNQETTTTDKAPTTEKEIGGGFVQVEQAGYGDYIDGNHVDVGSAAYFKFYETSKIGCKDAIDKKACAEWWINDLTPRKASVQEDLNGYLNRYDQIVKSIEESSQKITQLEDEILNYNPEETYTPLSDLKTALEGHKSNLICFGQEKVQIQDSVDAKKLEVEEYNKVLSVYYSILNN